MNAPNQQWCEDFLAVADPSELTLQLSCPIGSADTASNQLQYATIDGSLGYIIETMPAVRAALTAGMESVWLTGTRLRLVFGAESTWQASIAAVRAIDWSGERQFQVEVDEVTKLEWTATASGRATDVSANKGDLAPGSPPNAWSSCGTPARPVGLAIAPEGGLARPSQQDQ